MKKRLFGIILSLALMLTMVPVLGIEMTAYAYDDVIQAGSTYQTNNTIYFGDTQLWIQMDDDDPANYERFTGTRTLEYEGYNKDSGHEGQHMFSLNTEGVSRGFYISDTDGSTPWGIAVTGGDGSSQEKAFTFKVLHKAPVEYQLWIQGTQVTNWNKDDVLGDGTVSYDSEKNILTLNGADITTDADSQKIYSHVGIYYSGDEPLIIDAEKASTVTAMEGSGTGIMSFKNLTLKGTLTTSGAVSGISCSVNTNITVSGKVNATGGLTGIFLESGDITVNSGAELSAVGNEVAGIGSSIGDGEVVISEGAKVTAVGGEEGAIDCVVKNSVAGTGWTDKDGTAGETAIEVNTDGKKLDAKFKKAQFPAVEPVATQYTITYDLNGGTLDGQTGIVTKKIDAGKVITLPAPTRDGYTFDYWEGSRYKAGDKYTVTADHTFKAVWKAADKGGGSDSGDKGGSSKKGVNTGDENALGAWIVLMLAALAGTTGMVFARKRKGE